MSISIQILPFDDIDGNMASSFADLAVRPNMSGDYNILKDRYNLFNGDTRVSAQVILMTIGEFESSPNLFKKPESIDPAEEFKMRLVNFIEKEASILCKKLETKAVQETF